MDKQAYEAWKENYFIEEEFKRDGWTELNSYAGFKLGDLITAYTKGLHKLLGIVSCSKRKTPLFVYRPVCDSNGNPRKSKPDCCEYAYCKHAIDFIKETEENCTSLLTKLRSYLSG